MAQAMTNTSTTDRKQRNEKQPDPTRRFIVTKLLPVAVAASFFIRGGLLTDALAQTSGLTAEKVRTWFSRAGDYKSAPFGKGTIAPKQGTASLVAGTVTVDLTKQLAAIGLTKFSDQARIAYVGTSTRNEFGGEKVVTHTYFITDATAHGVLKVSINEKGVVDYERPLANEKISIPNGFAFACVPEDLAVAMLDLNLKILDFSEGMRGLDLSGYMAEKNPVNARLVGVKDGDTTYLLISADNFTKIYVFNYTKYISTGGKEREMTPFPKT